MKTRPKQVRHGTEMIDWDVVVVGGGPAGMMAAGRAAERGRRVVLLERNPVLGRKLVLTGGGRCNITNNISDRHELTSRYGDRGVFLHSLFARFSAEDTRRFFQDCGLDTKVEAEGRVFPVTESAYTVRDVLIDYMRSGGVRVRTDVTVSALETAPWQRDGSSDGGDTNTARVIGVRTSRKEVITGAAVVLALGGSARPDTGSRGDALPWLQALGAPVRIPDAALVPIRSGDDWVRRLQGLALSDAELIVEQAPRTGAGGDAGGVDDSRWDHAVRVLRRRGKVLFTHFGLSGPAVLNAAAAIREAADAGPIRILINPLPGRDPAALESELVAEAQSHGKRSISRVLRDSLPPRLADAVLAVAGIDGRTRLAVVSRTQRRVLIRVLTGIPCRYDGLMGPDKAVVSSGGVHPSAIDFRTMELRRVPGLRVLGDMIDFNRQSGGYSLQICWATGWVAGDSV